MYKLYLNGYTIKKEAIRQHQKHKTDKNSYISNSYQESLNFIDTRFFTASFVK